MKNQKFEIRNPKQIRNSNIPMTKIPMVIGIAQRREPFGTFEFLSFDIVSKFGFRASDFRASRFRIHSTSLRTGFRYSNFL
ncbi:MAG: hypothetical protein A2Z25_03290 [Planctomycetes bacterium RBG_16_55_9]|nr:MAG: hypothetical protein A2Z25_03290 [Planctomycetes bacterium RBG_16_55_9]